MVVLAAGAVATKAVRGGAGVVRDAADRSAGSVLEKMIPLIIRAGSR